MPDRKPLVARVGGMLPDPSFGQRLIDEAGGELRLIESEDRAEQLAAIRDADVIVHADGLRFTAEVYDQLEHCEAIIQTSVGFDNVDVAAATARKIIIGNLPDYCIEEVSDHAVTLVLAAGRRLF